MLNALQKKFRAHIFAQFTGFFKISGCYFRAAFENNARFYLQCSGFVFCRAMFVGHFESLVDKFKACFMIVDFSVKRRKGDQKSCSIAPACIEVAFMFDFVANMVQDFSGSFQVTHLKMVFPHIDFGIVDGFRVPREKRQLEGFLV